MFLAHICSGDPVEHFLSEQLQSVKSLALKSGCKLTSCQSVRAGSHRTSCTETSDGFFQLFLTFLWRLNQMCFTGKVGLTVCDHGDQIRCLKPNRDVF